MDNSKPTAKKLPKIRLDQLLVNLSLCPSRSRAQSLILAGKVRVSGQVVDKPGTLIQPVADTGQMLSMLQVEADSPFVSRGGLKLARALSAFSVDPAGRVCLDIGASTGGFTDCLLQQGAGFVYAIDVGYGQFDWRLRQDKRVCVLEKTNIRHLEPQALPENPLHQQPSLAVIDVSFISLLKVISPVQALLSGQSDSLIALIKPQFEYQDFGDGLMKRFKGVVSGMTVHQTILSRLIEKIQVQFPALTLTGLDFSPVRGPEGNIEFLACWQLSGLPEGIITADDIAAVVQKAYVFFGLAQASEDDSKPE